MNLVIAGVQGSGKGTQAAIIAKKYNLTHISTGDILREHIKNKTELGIAYQESYNAGIFASDDIIYDIIKQEITPDILRDGFILDGFPRNKNQRQWLINNYQIDGTIIIELDEEVAEYRMLTRRRSDDTPESINTRIQDFNKKTLPIIEKLPHVYYVDGDQAIVSVAYEIDSEIIAAIHTNMSIKNALFRSQLRHQKLITISHIEATHILAISIMLYLNFILG